jgi:hypothetical protein
MCLQLSSETFPVRRTIERDVIKDVYWTSRTWLFLAIFNETCFLTTDLRKIHQISRKFAQ